jgi:hypothetical protein
MDGEVSLRVAKWNISLNYQKASPLKMAPDFVEKPPWSPSFLTLFIYQPQLLWHVVAHILGSWIWKWSTAICKGIYPQNMAKNMVQYLHFRILKFPFSSQQLRLWTWPLRYPWWIWAAMMFMPSNSHRNVRWWTWEHSHVESTIFQMILAVEQWNIPLSHNILVGFRIG